MSQNERPFFVTGVRLARSECFPAKSPSHIHVIWRSAMPKPIARRDFLKTTAASSAAVAGASLAGTLGLAPRAYAAGKEVIRIGLIGCGGRGSGAATHALSVKP